MAIVKERHKQVLAKLVGNGGNMAQALREQKYSPAVVDNPKKVTLSKSWQELMKEKLDDDKLLLKHNQLLEDKDTNIQMRALDTAYKVKGRYSDTTTVNVAVVQGIQYIVPENKSVSIEAKVVDKESEV